MYMLQIEHPVPDYPGWKQVFDSDPIGLAKLGVRRYQILRPVGDPNHVMIEMEFDTLAQAEALLAALRSVPMQGDSQATMKPQARFVEIVEARMLEPGGSAAMPAD